MQAYVHNEDTGFVKLLYCPLRRHTNGADEQLGFLLDDDVDQFGKLTFGIIRLTGSILAGVTTSEQTQYISHSFFERSPQLVEAKDQHRKER